MKNKISLLLAWIISVSIFTSCNEKKTPQDFYITGIPLGSFSVDFSSLVDTSMFDEDCIEKVNIEELESKYSGTQKTIGKSDTILTGKYHSVIASDDYAIQYVTDDYYFSISRESEQLVEYELKLDIDEIINPQSSPKTATITLEEGRDIAESFLSSFIDLSEYEYRCGQYSDHDYKYSYSYDKKINGIETTEGVSIEVESWTGNVCRYDGYSLGKFKNVSLPEGFDVSEQNSKALDYFEKTVKEKIGTVVDSITSDISNCALMFDAYDNLYLSNKIDCCVDGWDVAFEVRSYIKQ